MSPITGPESGLDFASSLPLSPAASSAIESVFGHGWHDPSKLHHDSAKFRIVVEESRESIASQLGVDKANLEFAGEIGFGYWSALAGALKNSTGSFIHGATDRQVVHAFAREYQASGRQVRTLACGADGIFDYSEALGSKDADWVFWQATNRETGVEQSPISNSRVGIIADLTASFDPRRLPAKWDVALWDPRSFAGPEGLAILAINGESKWRSPIPPIDKRRLFGSFSKPLLILTALALADWVSDMSEKRAKLASFNANLRRRISTEISDVTIIGDLEKSDPRNIAMIFKDVVAEELLRKLDQRGIKVDAGSACGAGALSPSHVLEAMGFGPDGQIRLTLKNNQKESDLEQLVLALKDEVSKLR